MPTMNKLSMLPCKHSYTAGIKCFQMGVWQLGPQTPLCLLFSAQERLAASNRQLKQWHRVLAAKVAGLMATDLVRHKDK